MPAPLRQLGGGNTLHKEECCICMVPSQETYVCLHCDFTGCRNHASWHYNKTNGEHCYFLGITRSIMAPTVHEPGVRRSLGPVAAPDFLPISNQDITDLAQKIWEAHDAALVFEMAALRCGKAPCPHVHSLHQLPGTAVEKCATCHRDKNLWLCLQCGNVGCGRDQIGMEGAGHALHHSQVTGHTLAVKLDSLNGLDPVISADVYCYACDRDVEDPDLEAHLATFGVNYSEMRPTQQSLAQQELMQLMQQYYQGSNVERAVGVAGPELRGLRNTGNICYFHSVMQGLSTCRSLRSFADSAMLQHLADALPSGSSAYTNPQLQISRLLNGLIEGTNEYRDPGQVTSTVRLLSPLVVRSLTSGNELGKQQDAIEFLQLLTDERRDVFKQLEIGLVPEYHCPRCNKSVAGYAQVEHCIRASLFDTVQAFPGLEIVPLKTILSNGVGSQQAGYVCPFCQKKTVAEISYRVNSWPDNLVIAIERAGLDPMGHVTKLATDVDAGDEIDISDMTAEITSGEVYNTLIEMEIAEGLARRAAAGGRSLEDALDYVETEQMCGRNLGEARYSLRAVVNHIGNTGNHGHYIAYKNFTLTEASNFIPEPLAEHKFRRLLETSQSIWVEFNDEVVKAGIDPLMSQAVLLFYERCR